MKLFRKPQKKVTIDEVIATRKQAQMQELMRQEREVTEDLFGDIEHGRKRDFFCLDEDTWVWYEEWLEDGVRKTMTTRYHIQPDQIVKSQNSGPKRTLTEKEVVHFVKAVQRYNTMVQEQLYSS